MHHMIEMKEIPATVLVNFSKLMLDEWCTQFVLISPTRAMLLQKKFLQKCMVDPYAIYGYNKGHTLQFQHSLPMSTIGRKNQYIKTFEFCAKNVV